MQVFFPVNFAKFLGPPILNNICEQLLLYFHYNPHHHYHCHHFHYHCKMNFYHLRILWTIPLDCNMIPSLFQHIYFSSLIPSFLFFMHSIFYDSEFFYDHQTTLTCSLYTCIYIYSYLHLLAYTYLNLLIYSYVFFIPLYNKFLKKNYQLGKWAILGPKIVHPYNSGSAVRIFLNFADWKGTIGRWK